MLPSVSERFHLTLPGNLAREPVIYTLGERFGLVTNIRRAGIEEDSGWVILEVDGPGPAISEALAWLEERGVHIDRIEG